MRQSSAAVVVGATLLVGSPALRETPSQNPQMGQKPQTGVTPINESRRISDFKIKIPTRASDKECRTPKPQPIGCTTICKPCTFWICEKGEWKRQQLDYRDICPPHHQQEGPTGCPRGENGFCPAECSFCV